MTGCNVLCVDLEPGSLLGKELREILARTYRVVQLHDYRRLIAERHTARSSRSPKFEAVIVVSPSHLQSRVKEIIRRRTGRFAELPIILVMNVDQPEAIVNFLRLGATDFITPPLKRAEILPRIWRLVDQRRREDPVSSGLFRRLGLAGLVGESSIFQECVEKLPLYAKCDATVMIEGETGTGKGLCARAIHYLSARSTRPFVAVSCGAIPVELFENELFGHERAAFTGASASYAGLVCTAERGTLFLDEIDCIPFSAQSKLLGLLQDKSYRALGSPKNHTADIRLIAASNANVEEAVRQGKLRRDLYYRLNVLSLRLPPLRERSEDILPLADHFLLKFSAELKQSPLRLASEAAQALLQHDWPGNVRELENVLERAAILAGNSGIISRSEILLPFSSSSEQKSFQTAKAQVVANFEVSYIKALLNAHGGNITRAAKTAKKNRRAFWELIRKHGIDTDAYRPCAL